MTQPTIKPTDTSPADAPPPGTAIVRPLRHVRAVRDRHLLQFDDPAQITASPAVRAWAWALGETATAPVTGRQFARPPARPDIETEIAAADDRRLREGRLTGADAAATILRWLIGDDDHVPVRTDSPGELVGGFGPIIRSPAQITSILTLAAEGQQRAAAQDRDLRAHPDSRRYARQDAGYLAGVAATLAWILGDTPEAPISHQQPRELTSSNLKRELVRASDVIEQSRYPWMADQLPPPWYGKAVKLTITWLLGDTTTPPVDPGGHGPYHPDSQLPAMLRDAWARQRSL